MTFLGDLAMKRLSAIPDYRPGRSAGGLAPGKLSANESVLGPGPHVQAALGQVTASIGSYPSELILKEKLAGRLGVAGDQLIISNGSDEICFLVAQVFLGFGTVALLGDPAYQIDATVSLISGADVIRVPLLSDGGHDFHAMAKEASVARSPK